MLVYMCVHTVTSVRTMKWECHQSTHPMTALVQVLTGTYHSGIFAVPTIVCPDLGMGTFQETLLPTGAQDLIQPHGPHPLPKVGCPGGIGCRAVAQHPAHHISVLQDPPIITHRAPPLAVVVHLHAWVSHLPPDARPKHSLKTEWEGERNANVSSYVTNR